MFFLCRFIFFYLLQTLFPPPTSALVLGVWADPFVPTAILGETHFLFPLLLIIYFKLKEAAEHYIYKMAVWRLNCEDKKKSTDFLLPIFGSVGSFFLTKDGFLTFIPACCFSSPVPPLSPPSVPPPPFLPSSPPSPSDEGALLGWGWLHSIPSALRVVRVMSHTCLTSHMHGQTCGLDVGGVSKGGVNGGAVGPGAKATARWSRSSCTETQNRN